MRKRTLEIVVFCFLCASALALDQEHVGDVVGTDDVVQNCVVPACIDTGVSSLDSVPLVGALVMPALVVPDEARIAQYQRIIAAQVHENARNRLVVRGLTALGMCCLFYTFFGPAKSFVRSCVGKSQELSGAGNGPQVPVPLDQETIDQVRAFNRRSWVHKVFEVMGYSSLGFFVTQQLEWLSGLLATSLFYPVTAQWFIEHKHPVIQARIIQEGAQEVMITRSPYLEEIERFVQVCSASSALSMSAHDPETYFVITGLNSFIRQLEMVLGFMGYQHEHATPLLAVEIRVTRDTLMQYARHFSIRVDQILRSATLPLEEKKTTLISLAQEMRLHLSRLLVDRLYRLESEN